MDCLNNVVGISARCSSAIPSSGLYLNDLDHISVEIADAAIDSEMQSGIELLERKRALAQNDLENDIRQWIAPRMNFNSVIQNDRVGIIKNNRELADNSANTYAGIKIEPWHTHSQYFELHIHSISIWLDATETVTVYLFDRTTGETLDTYTIDAIKDQPTSIVVDETYRSNKNYLQLALVADTTANPYETRVYPHISGCRTCRNKHAYHNEYLSFYGIELGTSEVPVDPNFTSRSDTAGLSMDYSLSCSLDKIVCNMSNLIATPLMYKWGEYVIRALHASTRLNHVVRLYSDEHEGLIEYYHAQYKSYLRGVLDTIQTPTDLCFSCNSRVKTVTSIP